MKTEYIDTRDQAKLIRKMLKNKFPGIKFSVRISRYAGGSSITVRWTDGPTTKMVERFTKPFAGGGFDGMIDMAYDVRTWLLPDGTCTVASSPGTEGSRGVIPAIREWMPEPGSILVRFAGRYVFCERDYSPDFYKRGAECAAEKFGVDPDALTFSEPSNYDGSIYCTNARNIKIDNGREGGYAYLDTEINYALSRRTNYAMEA